MVLKSIKTLKEEGWTTFAGNVFRYCPLYMVTIEVNLRTGEYYIEADRKISRNLFNIVEEKYPIHEAEINFLLREQAAGKQVEFLAPSGNWIPCRVSEGCTGTMRVKK